MQQKRIKYQQNQTLDFAHVQNTNLWSIISDDVWKKKKNNPNQHTLYFIPGIESKSAKFGLPACSNTFTPWYGMVI